MMLANIGKNQVNVTSDVGTWCLNASYDLWNDFKPGVYVDHTEPVGYGMANFIMGSKAEP